MPRENADSDEDEDVCIPLVITVPFTQRFKLSGPAALASPFMPLLESKCPLEYIIEFVRPQVTESDYVWDNFQDQIVIQTRLSKLVVKLQATKESPPSDSAHDATSFFPRSLSEIKAPSLKLFEYIEKNHSVASTEHIAMRRPERVSESFNGSKKKTESALAPLRPRSPADKSVFLPAIPSSRPSSSERSQTPPFRPISGSNATKSDLSTVATAAEVSNQMEAKAIILKLRARNSTRSGASSLLMPSQAHSDEFSPEAPFPESRLDAKTKTELDNFNRLVVSVKEGVKRDQASAKSELDYYRQFLPRAPSDVLTPRDITPREAMVAPSSLKPLMAPTDHSSNAGLALAAAVSSSSSIAPAKRAKPLPVNKASTKLPTLSALSLSPQTGSLPSSSSSLEVENNQETSPVRASTTTAAKKPKDPPRVTHVARPAAPSQPQKSAAGTTGTKSSVSAVRTKAGELSETGNLGSAATKHTPFASHQHTETRANVKKQNQPPAKKTAATATKKKTNQQLPVAKKRDPEAALSDFDDPDPEVDDAPILPDDLGGMRATLSCGDDDDEY